MLTSVECKVDVERPREIRERRSHRRYPTAYRPGCVIHNNEIYLGLIRNLSKGGAKIDLDHDLRVGDRIAYFWDEQKPVVATVGWTDDGAYGLINEHETELFDDTFGYRSLRVPCAVDAEVWIGGESHLVKVENLSMGGMRVSGLDAWPGALLTINVCGLELYNASVRWFRKGEAGINFSDRLSRAQLAMLLMNDAVKFDRIHFEG